MASEPTTMKPGLVTELRKLRDGLRLRNHIPRLLGRGVIKPFDIWDHFAGHVRLTVSSYYTILHINGRVLYFTTGGMDGTGMGCNGCCEEAHAADEAGTSLREAAGTPNFRDREADLIREADFDVYPGGCRMTPEDQPVGLD